MRKTQPYECPKCSSIFYTWDSRRKYCSKECSFLVRFGNFKEELCMPEVKLDGRRTLIRIGDLDVAVDSNYYDYLSRFKWSIDRYPYITRTVEGKKKTIRMHRLIMGDIPKGMVVDHIDGNKLNNCRANLRICTQRENALNCRGNSKSGYKGVMKRGKRYLAYIDKSKGNRKYLGTYDSKEEAGRAYNDEAKKMFGEFARLNEF